MAQSIRVIARMMMPGWVKSGLSAARVTQELVNRFGAAYRRTTLLEDYREFRGVVLHETGIRSLRQTTLIPRNLMTETVLRLPRRYLISAKATVINPLTAEEETRWISWYTDLRDSKENLKREYMERLAVSMYEESELPVHISIRSVRHHKELNY